MSFNASLVFALLEAPFSSENGVWGWTYMLLLLSAASFLRVLCDENGFLIIFLAVGIDGQSSPDVPAGD